MADSGTADWYLTAALRAVAEVIRQGVDDAQLLRVWRAYMAGAAAYEKVPARV